MRLMLAFALWAVVCPAVLSAQVVREMTQERIQEAIALGESKKEIEPYKIQEKARWSWPPRIGAYSTPFLRVAIAANAAKKRYKPFSAADVTAEMIAPEIHVYAPPVSVGGVEIANVEAVVIMPHKGKDRSKAIQPSRSEELTLEYKNLFGYSTEGRGVLAVFSLDVLDPANEFHVVFDRKIPSSQGQAPRGGCSDCSSRIYLEGIK